MFLSMNLLLQWIPGFVSLCLFSIHSLGVTLSFHLGVKGKKTAWNTWQNSPEATEAFEELLLMQGDISDHTMSVVERFVVLL